jgi:hypothetical protein
LPRRAQRASQRNAAIVEAAQLFRVPHHRSVTVYMGKCIKPAKSKVPPTQSTNGTVSSYQRTPAETTEIANFQKRFAGDRPLAPIKATKSADALTIAFDHPDQALVGTRMANSFATADPQFCEGLLLQISHFASNRAGDLDTKAMDFMLATVKGIAPQDPIETLLSIQMAAVHTATITAAKQLKTAEFVDGRDHALTALNKCARTFALQVETLKKHRSTGEQSIRVQHVTVNDGGQAIVADRVQTGGGGNNKRDNQPHEPQSTGESSANECGPALLGNVKTFGPAMPSPSAEGAQSVPMPRRARRSAYGQTKRPIHDRRIHD